MSIMIWHGTDPWRAESALLIGAVIMGLGLTARP